MGNAPPNHFTINYGSSSNYDWYGEIETQLARLNEVERHLATATELMKDLVSELPDDDSIKMRVGGFITEVVMAKLLAD